MLSMMMLGITISAFSVGSSEVWATESQRGPLFIADDAVTQQIIADTGSNVFTPRKHGEEVCP